MSSTKKTVENNDSGTSSTFKSTAENIMLIKQDSGARELNNRLQTMEAQLYQLREELGSSYHNLQQRTHENHSEVKQSQDKINQLEGLYHNLDNKSGILAKETARLTLIINDNSQLQSNSLQSLEQLSEQQFKHLSGQIKSLDKQLLQLSSDAKSLAQESESLIHELTTQTSDLSKSFTEHTSNFKQLAQDIELRNKNLDSKLEQVGRNFTFHDTKILKLHEKSTELEDKNNSLKALLQQTDSEHKTTLNDLEQSFRTDFNTLSDATGKQYQDLTSEQNELSQRSTQIETKVEQLKSVDKELSARAEGLRKTTQRLDEHSDILEKTTVSLRKHSHELQRAVNQLDKQNEQLEDKTDELGMQIVVGAQTERQHFQTLTIALSVVAVITVLALVYSFINQQSLWQSSMDNDLVIERRMSNNLSEQNARVKVVEQNLQQAEQQRLQLANNIEVLQTQLKAEQEKSASLLQASQDKSRKIVQLDSNLKAIDDNVKFLNSSVGPLKDYARNTGRKALYAPDWLAQQAVENFSIQLASVSSKQALYSYIEKHGYSLQNTLAWFTLKSKGKDYYVLTYGSFKTLAQARAVFSQLPAFVTENSPGIARMKDIQSFIH